MLKGRLLQIDLSGPERAVSNIPAQQQRPVHSMDSYHNRKLGLRDHNNYYNRLLDANHYVRLLDNTLHDTRYDTRHNTRHNSVRLDLVHHRDIVLHGKWQDHNRHYLGALFL